MLILSNSKSQLIDASYSFKLKKLLRQKDKQSNTNRLTPIGISNGSEDSQYHAATGIDL
jgi:hypothetical protein